MSKKPTQNKKWSIPKKEHTSPFARRRVIPTKQSIKGCSKESRVIGTDSLYRNQPWLADRTAQRPLLASVVDSRGRDPNVIASPYNNMPSVPRSPQQAHSEYYEQPQQGLQPEYVNRPVQAWIVNIEEPDDDLMESHHSGVEPSYASQRHSAISRSEHDDSRPRRQHTRITHIDDSEDNYHRNNLTYDSHTIDTEGYSSATAVMPHSMQHHSRPLSRHTAFDRSAEHGRRSLKDMEDDGGISDLEARAYNDESSSDCDDASSAHYHDRSVGRHGEMRCRNYDDRSSRKYHGGSPRRYSDRTFRGCHDSEPASTMRGAQPSIA